MRAVWEWLRAQTDQPRVPAEPAGPAAATQVMRFGPPVAENAITDLCMQALEKFGRPAKTRQLSDLLVREGHDISVAQVRGAMRYLATKKNAPPGDHARVWPVAAPGGAASRPLSASSRDRAPGSQRHWGEAMT